MIVPPYLKKGDKVILVSPAKRLQSGLTQGISTLESWGLKVVLGEHVFSESDLFAGTDSERLSDLQSGLDDPNIKAVIMARGGYGTTRILDDLDFSGFKKSPKWICGFSDVTVLLQRLVNEKVQAIHSTVGVLIGKAEHSESDESLKKALFGDGISYSFKTTEENRSGIALGSIVGGNLSMICNSIGTSSEVNTNGKILFLEDVGEYLYHLDRMLVQLKRAGKFDQLVGLIIGKFSSMKDHQDTFGLMTEEVINYHLSEFDFPIAHGFLGCHETPNLALYFGREAQLS